MIKVFNARKTTSTYNNGDTWEVLDTRTNEVIKTFNRASKAVGYRDYCEAQLIEAIKLWELWDK